MKTFSFNLCHYTITVTIEKKPYKTTSRIEKKPYKTTSSIKSLEDALNSRFADINLKFKEEFLKPVSVEDILDMTGVKKEPREEIKMEDLRSVEECFTEYIESQRGILSAATIKGYENIRDKHLDRIMVCYISRLDEAVIQRAFDEELAKGYSEKTIKGYKTLLMKVLAVYRPDLHPEIRIKKETDDENA